MAYIVFKIGVLRIVKTAWLAQRIAAASNGAVIATAIGSDLYKSALAELYPSWR